MSSTDTVERGIGRWAFWRRQDLPESPRPLESLVASAMKLRARRVSRVTHEKWQQEAWQLRDLLGEVRFPAVTKANAVSRATLFAARMPANENEDLKPLEEGPAWEAVRTLGTRAGRSQLLKRIAEQIEIAGESWLVGLPPKGANGDDDMPLDELTWMVVSSDELDNEDKDRAVEADRVPLERAQIRVRIWNPHPRHWWQADSPIRSSLPVLRELVDLTKHVSAQIDSRLAGAGMLAMLQGMQVVNEEGQAISAMDALMESMIQSRENRDLASSLVPLIAEVPGDDASKAFHWIKFWTELDKEARPLREEAIRRWALGADIPPELLLGMSTGNHWTAWLIREETVVTHLEPLLALICDALTTQYLWPILEELGIPEVEARQHVIWYNSSMLTQRPNRADLAVQLHERKVISDDALRREAGFDDGDAPIALEPGQRALEMVVNMVTTAPTLIREVGIPELVRQMRQVLDQIPTEDNGEGVAQGDEIRDIDEAENDDVPRTDADEPTGVTEEEVRGVDTP